MERTIGISVIIPTRNRLEFLRQAVASVREQSFSDWELIVVDDCSQDGTWDWLASLEDERIRPLRLERHRERSAARNAGLNVARGDSILLLDDDDWLLDGALACLDEALRAEPRAIGCMGGRLEKNSRGSMERAYHDRRRCCRDISEELWLGRLLLHGQMLLRRSILLKADGWDEKLTLGEDRELWLRIARFGPVVIVPEAVFAYRLHPGQDRKLTLGPRMRSLDRRSMAGLTGRKRERAELCIRSRRLVGLARRSYRNAKLRRAAVYTWQAVGCAPWLLRFPLIRKPVLQLALRCSAGALLGERGVLAWRDTRKILAERLGRSPRSGDGGEGGENKLLRQAGRI